MLVNTNYVFRNPKISANQNNYKQKEKGITFTSLPPKPEDYEVCTRYKDLLQFLIKVRYNPDKIEESIEKAEQYKKADQAELEAIRQMQERHDRGAYNFYNQCAHDGDQSE